MVSEMKLNKAAVLVATAEHENKLQCINIYQQHCRFFFPVSVLKKMYTSLVIPCPLTGKEVHLIGSTVKIIAFIAKHSHTILIIKSTFVNDK